MLATLAPPPPAVIQVHIAQERLHTVDEAYLSVALDSALLMNAPFWQRSKPTASFSFQHPRFLALSQLLTRQAPTYLRIGGTDADRVAFAANQSTESGLQKQGLLPLTPEHWQTFHNLSTELGTPLIFTLSTGPHTHNPHWALENASQIMAQAQQANTPIKAWEWGNEPNGYPLFFGRWPSAATYATQLVQLQQQHPHQPLAGPATAWWPHWGEPLGLSPDILRQAGQHLSFFTWHYYPQQSQRCAVQTRPTSTHGLLEPTALNTGVDFARHQERLRRRYAIQAPHWLGETGHAQCGGSPEISDRWASSLWWLDQLGALAKVGVSLQVRQALVGSDYGLLAEQSFEPRPDFWSSVLWKQLMGPEVLHSPLPSGATPRLRHYVHCHPRQGISLLGINLQNQTLSLQVPGPWQGAQQYVLSAPHLKAKQVWLNGSPISETQALAQQGLSGRPLTQNHLQIPAYGAAFVHLPQYQHPGCPS